MRCLSRLPQTRSVMEIHVVGIDPGLRDTGVVLLSFDTNVRTVTGSAFAVDGQVLKADVSIIRRWLDSLDVKQPHVFIEKYVPRPGMSTSPDMLALENLIRVSLKDAQLVRNTGVKQVVTPAVLQLLNVWRFTFTTNHDDLRAAARIAVYGMMKDPTRQLNTLLADVIMAELDGNPWTMKGGPSERYAP